MSKFYKTRFSKYYQTLHSPIQNQDNEKGETVIVSGDDDGEDKVKDNTNGHQGPIFYSDLKTTTNIVPVSKYFKSKKQSHNFINHYPSPRPSLYELIFKIYPAELYWKLKKMIGSMYP